MNKQKPLIAILLGDPSGIGPELISKFLKNKSSNTDVIIVGEKKIADKGDQIAKVKNNYNLIKDIKQFKSNSNEINFIDISKKNNRNYTLGKCSANSGASVLESLKYSLDLGKKNLVDGILFAPFNKASMQMAGSKYEDELHLIADELSLKNFYCELNFLNNFWTSRVTSHIDLKKVAPMINQNSVLQPIILIDRTLKKTGMKKPRIAVCGINPHAGDSGLFGREEIDIIEPAIKKATDHNIDASGPYPADTIFVRAYKNKEFDAVVTMYHDQGQIAMKLIGFDRGVTVQGGLPFPITTPAHGTAFDIAGKGIADPNATIEAFKLICQMTNK